MRGGEAGGASSQTDAAGVRLPGFAAHPAGLAPLFFAELWERFSYYGMRALLTLFMVAPLAAGGLGLDVAEAARIYGNYTMAVYVLAIPGGYIADAGLGARRAVLWGGTVIACGHFLLAVPARAGFFLGLVLIALGTGLLKPAMSALVGGLYARDDERRDAGFSLFYLGINLGALLAPIVTGFLAQSAVVKDWLAARGFDPAMSWHLGFAASGVGMTLGLIVFVRHVKALPDQHERRRAGATAEVTATSNDTPTPKNTATPNPSPHRGGAAAPPRGGGEPGLRGGGDVVRRAAAVTVATLLLIGLVWLSDRPGWQGLRLMFVAAPLAAAIHFARSPSAEMRRLAAVAVFFIAAMLFWALFEQAGLSIALFSDELTRNEIGGVGFPSSWFQALNPLFVILLAPVFAYAWTRLGSRQPSSGAKFVIGLVLLSASFALMVPAAKLTAEGRVSPLWLVGLFLLQTLGELCVSPVGLSLMTRLAPPGMVGVTLGLWFLASAFGNKIAGIIGAEFAAKDAGLLAQFFGRQAFAVAVVAVLLALMLPWLKRLMGEVR